MTLQELTVDLTKYIRNIVRPHLGAWQGREISGTAASGDVTFHIDDIAEEAIVSYLERCGLSIAYYSEDKGLIKFGASPEAVLVIDPIDGTRPAVAGYECCVVSVALADYKDGVTMGDVRFGCIAEIKSNNVFFAETGQGAHWFGDNDVEKPLRLLPITDLREAPVTFEIVARPIKLLTTVLEDVINNSALKGGCFVFSSSAFSLTRLITGQLGAALDVGNRILRDRPDFRNQFVELGHGKTIGIFSYDIAAAALIAREAGAIVTDAYGRSLDSVPLLDTSESNQHSMIGASNAELHKKILESIEIGMRRLPS